MDQPSLIAPPLTSPQYPAPPLVHWSALLIVAIIAGVLFDRLLPDSAADFAVTLLWGAWVIYLCLWIRKLDANSKAFLWALASIAVALACDAFNLPQNPSSVMIWISYGLEISDFGLGIAVAFVIRAELQDHYNNREPIGLHLGGVMTFFFSYLYFQYHLYEIAQFKKRQAEGDVSYAGRTLLP
jgi:hypothetical protein